MSGLIYHTDKRRLVPQLETTESYKDTQNLSTIKIDKIYNPLLPNISLHEEDLEEKVRKWRKTKDLNLAGDILSQAIESKNDARVIEIKNYLLSKYPSDSILQWLHQSKHVVTSNEDRISHNHDKLSIEPKDALTWTDQAINYISINDRTEAIKCIEQAITINSSMGFIVRNASRIFSLTGDTNRSIRLLKNSEYYKYDPQIVSAEIAFSQLENRYSTGIEIAHKLVKDPQFQNSEKSELASSLATVEYFKDNFKKSEQLFDQSLLAPNKNSFAQSLWYKKDTISPQKFDAYKDSNEIQAHKNSKENNFKLALEYALKWKGDEPYSVRPYRLASHISGVLLGNYEDAFQLSKLGMESQKTIKADNYTHDEELDFYNDLAYCSLKCGNFERAEKYIVSLIDLIGKGSNLTDTEFIYNATLGLYNYKNNNPDLGRMLYRKAISHFIKSRKTYLAGSAFLNFFEEEIRVKTSVDSFEKLRNELNDIIPEDTPENELLYRKRNALKMLNEIVKNKL